MFDNIFMFIRDKSIVNNVNLQILSFHNISVLMIPNLISYSTLNATRSEIFRFF